MKEWLKEKLDELMPILIVAVCIGVIVLLICLGIRSGKNDDRKKASATIHRSWDGSDIHIYEVRVSGSEYILVENGKSVAICPKAAAALERQPVYR